ncbi:tyrosine-protein phosphatase [Texcoconibacillus texcoconensis]|uniref:Tyrosine-protein phosphatase n=1 Tax=Texcoconibacillus texcoconensis TaxID=1095777 RepID=A0A840QTD8_9BACI|nr:CpsB/CapC family capsule biosynthesis tyrosine phosphatase [Texcoconibacillus texcoconensis]MBB5174569.1 protein-tyrosine phosphatase [Texcoconibacillus texcoconensis]
MIDCHCHILPEVDDGPTRLADSIKLAKEAEREGITTIITTPHHNVPTYENTHINILRKTDELNAILKKENINVDIIPGQEARIHGEMVEGLETGDILTVANAHEYVFVELPSNHVPRFTSQLLYDIQLTGVVPVIVHPERNTELIDNPDILYNLVKAGAVTQITTSSITGHFGKKIKKFTEQLITHNLTHLIASDAHNTTTRPFRWQQAKQQIEKTINPYTWQDFQENARRLTTGKALKQNQPQYIKRKKLFGIPI